MLQERSPWSVTEICKRASISRASFYDVIRGRFRLKGKKLASLLKALDANSQTSSKIIRLSNSERNFNRSHKPRKIKRISMNKTITLSLDDKTQKMLLLLAKAGEEKFDKAKVVGLEETMSLSAAQYVKDLIEKSNERENIQTPSG